jgi:hypothetical protein
VSSIFKKLDILVSTVEGRVFLYSKCGSQSFRGRFAHLIDKFDKHLYDMIKNRTETTNILV